MARFSEQPEEPKEFDPDVARAELLAGRFNPTPKEVEAERREIGGRRETSEEARARLQDKHDKATGRLREKQSEQATRETIAGFERVFHKDKK